ncbi:GNAT family N-acetyltransferase [Polaribacter sp.]|jgi:ribosomal-protein-alanine N-acetyltransferase|nr:GNAT family N-acetyltransferase [Polaribacter sp.]MDA9977288.1 GNAT family N-acetyltransferase [Polaribacter sp.]MDB0039836.1 GNAT family N-acetyltransferase [Polaribacter sp.]MDB4167951.1 GNAT family N-acetyltransferase [Polaribacter sp.]MDB9748735.1 GNAT family N-acetyltransferase [Polaribacter sp.]
MVFNCETFPILKTQRLTLRKLKLDDAAVILALRSSEEINKFVATKRMQNLEEAKDFIQTCNALFQKEKRIFWAITKQEEVLGTIVLHRISLTRKYAEIGYKLKTEMQQKGFMNEAITAVLHFGIEQLNLKTIEAYTHKNNVRSIMLLEKHQFIFQAHMKDPSFEHNRIYRFETSS